MNFEIIGPDIGVASAARDWWDIGWNLVNGCTRVSEGCRHCTAEIMMARGKSPYAELKDGPHDARWTGAVEAIPKALAHPAHWTAPCWVFVCPMSDLFHEDVPDAFLAEAIAVMAAFPQHRFGICTKRADRMQRFFQRGPAVPDNVLVGTTVEDASTIDRLNAIMAIPARHRWVSVEPMLSALDLRNYLGRNRIGWVTFGPEIGQGRRLCDPAWVDALLSQCRSAGVPFFTKHRLDSAEIREKPMQEESPCS